MFITKEFAEVWNALVDMGFNPSIIDSGVIDIMVCNTSEELDFAAAVMDFRVHLTDTIPEESERLYKVNGFTVRVCTVY